MTIRESKPHTTTLSTDLLERVLIGGNHLALLIGADHPSYAAAHDKAQKHYRQNHDGYEAWCCWRVIMELRDAIDAPWVTGR